MHEEAIPPLPFHPDEVLAVERTLPAGADKAAVLCALAQLAGHIIEGYAYDRRVSAKEERDRWVEIEELARTLAYKLHRVRPLRTVPDPVWFQPTLQALGHVRREASSQIEGHEVRVRARARGHDPYRRSIIVALLGIWTDVAGGELRYFRNSKPDGPLIAYLTITLDLLLGHHLARLKALSKDRKRLAMPTPEALAEEIRDERARRAHTESEKAKRGATG